VRAKDAEGNVDSTPAAATWTVTSTGGLDLSNDNAFLGGNACSAAGSGSSLGLLGLAALAVLHARRRRQA
jgi:MYXO-CTERM domain-containing protein